MATWLSMKPGFTRATRSCRSGPPHWQRCVRWTHSTSYLAAAQPCAADAQVAQALDYTERWVTLLYQAARGGRGCRHGQRQPWRTRQRMDPCLAHVFIYEHCLPLT